MKTPNPGSPEAVEAGCTCPVLDNRRGKGCYKAAGGEFVIAADCPVHAATTSATTPQTPQTPQTPPPPKPPQPGYYTHYKGNSYYVEGAAPDADDPGALFVQYRNIATGEPWLRRVQSWAEPLPDGSARYVRYYPQTMPIDSWVVLVLGWDAKGCGPSGVVGRLRDIGIAVRREHVSEALCRLFGDGVVQWGGADKNTVKLAPKAAGAG